MNIYEPKKVKELITDMAIEIMAIEIQELKRELASVKSSKDMWYRNYQEEKKKYEDLKSKLEAKNADLEKQIAEYEGRKAE